MPKTHSNLPSTICASRAGFRIPIYKACAIVQQAGAVFKGLWLLAEREPFVVFESTSPGLILVLPLAGLTVAAVREKLRDYSGKEATR